MTNDFNLIRFEEIKRVFWTKTATCPNHNYSTQKMDLSRNHINTNRNHGNKNLNISTQDFRAT
jgi:hypothetical protein